VDSTGCVQILHLGKLCLDVFHPISESFVVSNGASLSEVQYAERGAGQVIARISLMQVHRADPHCTALLRLYHYSPQLHSTSLASPHLGRDQFCRRSWRLATRRHLECHEAKYAICRVISTLDRRMNVIFPSYVYGVLSYCLLHRATRDSPSHEYSFFDRIFSEEAYYPHC
jgi:hypothetical protein